MSVAPSKPSLAQRLVGGWALVSFTGRTPSGRTIYPMGEEVRGHLVYSADGLVSVNLMEAARRRAATDVRLGLLDDADAAPLARTYMAYSGAYSVDEQTRVVTHDFELCLDPALIGTLQQRRATFLSDDELELSVPSFELDRFAAPVSLRWRRFGAESSDR